MKSIEEMQAKLGLLEAEQKALNARVHELRTDLSNAIAAQKGIGVGTIVTCTKTLRWGIRERTVKNRARVTKIVGRHMWGVTIRKDGSDGVARPLYSFDNWQPEAQP